MMGRRWSYFSSSQVQGFPTVVIGEPLGVDRLRQRRCLRGDEEDRGCLHACCYYDGDRAAEDAVSTCNHRRFEGRRTRKSTLGVGYSPARTDLAMTILQATT